MNLITNIHIPSGESAMMSTILTIYLIRQKLEPVNNTKMQAFQFSHVTLSCDSFTIACDKGVMAERSLIVAILFILVDLSFCQSEWPVPYRYSRRRLSNPVHSLGFDFFLLIVQGKIILSKCNLVYKFSFKKKSTWPVGGSLQALYQRKDDVEFSIQH